MPSTIWESPPWAESGGVYRMGLKPIGAEDWLPERIDRAERERKLTLIQRDRDRVVASLAGSETAQRRVEAMVGISTDEADPVPIVRASLAVPDDLCLMQRVGHSYQLTAACLCAPSYWRLTEKVGLDLSGIHAPVEGVNAAIGPQMLRFFDGLDPHRVFERRNWFIHRKRTLFQPDAEDWSGPLDVEALQVRSERQTLRRVDATSIVFSIRVTVRPIIEIAHHPNAARDLLAAFSRMSDVERAHLSHEHYGAALETYLAPIAAKAAPLETPTP